MNRMNYFIFFLVSACASYFDHYLIQTEPTLNNGWAATHMPLPLPASNMYGYHAFKVEKFRNMKSLYITLSQREKPVCGNPGQTLSQLA